MSTTSENLSLTKELESTKTSQSLQISDFQNLQPSFKLNGRNYIVWSQIVRTFLKGKGKLSHLTGPIPSEDEPSFSAWDVEDSSIMSWLWNSMQPEISGTCMFLTTAKDIWDTVKQTYSKVRDAALVYEIKTKIHSTKQGTFSVTDYYSKMKNLWLELDYYQNIKMQCSNDAAMMLKFVEGERVYDFLAGLNVEYDQVRVQILGKDTLPSLNEVFSTVRGEEGRRGVMLETIQTDGSALVVTTPAASDISVSRSIQPTVQKHSNWPVNTNFRSASSKEGLFCNYCKKPGHTKDICWKLRGKGPPRNNNSMHFQPRNHQANVVQTEGMDDSQELNGLNREEIEKLRSFLTTIDKPIGSCSLAQSGSEHGEDDWAC